MAKSKQRTMAVEFGSVAVQAETVRIGVKIGHDKLPPKDAHDLLRYSRLNVKLELDNGQQSFDDENAPIESVVDAKGYRVGTTTYSVGLTFALSEVDYARLARFHHCDGLITLERIGEPEDKRSKDGDPDDPDQTAFA